MEINASAPAVARGAVEVAAPPEIVWEVLTDIAAWPRWNPDVKRVSIDGPPARGTEFRWKAGPGTITSTLQSIEPPSLIAWTGTTFGIDAVHVYRLEQHGDTTIVRSEESWEGLLVRVLRRPMKNALHKAIESGLRHLKIEAEDRAAKRSDSPGRTSPP